MKTNSGQQSKEPLAYVYIVPSFPYNFNTNSDALIY